jgi:glycosyltransferase involved in cell wall biosynthesis
MPTLPTLSVVVPNYNHGKYLEFSLPALLRQSVQPLEIIVLDDVSTDNSVEVIRRFAAQSPLIRLVQNE